MYFGWLGIMALTRSTLYSSITRHHSGALLISTAEPLRASALHRTRPIPGGRKPKVRRSFSPPDRTGSWRSPVSLDRLLLRALPGIRYTVSIQRPEIDWRRRS